MNEELIPDDVKIELEQSLVKLCDHFLTKMVDKFHHNKRVEIVDAQQNIIKGFIKLEKFSEGYRQHDAFEAICTLFNQTYDRFMDCYLKNNPN